MRRLIDDHVRVALVLGLLVAVAFPLWFQFGHLKNYGGASLWPGLIGNFVASFAAFVIALSWDRQQRQQERENEAYARAERIEQETAQERALRETEARRLLDVVVSEMEATRGEIRQLRPISVGDTPPLRLLLTGAWARSAERLARILSRSDLVAEVSGFYDRISELQWRLRLVTEVGGVAFRQPDLREIVNSTDLLVRSIDDDFDALLERVKNEADAPSVDLLGIRREVAIADTLVSTGSAAIHATSDIG
jgi:hypothetical protein